MPSEEDLKKTMKAADGIKTGGLTPPKKVGLVVANVAKSVSPASHKSAAKSAAVKDAFDYDTALHMAFIGAGQGGGKIAQGFWDAGYRRVAAFNTTDSDFEGLDPTMPKLSLDIGGAAKDMQLARNAIKGRDEEVRDLMVRGWGNQFDCALVCVGLGGGSGGGTALPLVEMARKYMESVSRPVRVGAVVSLPSTDEGQQICRNAYRAFQELREAKVSPLIVIDNDKVDQLYHPPMSDLLPKSNMLVAQLFHLFNQLGAARSSHITFDRSEFTQLLDGGIVVMGSADIPVEEITSPADVSEAIRTQLAESVLADVKLETGRKAACIFVAGRSVLGKFGREYFSAGFTRLNRIVGGAHPEGTETVVHRGLYEIGDDGLQCYTLVSEVDPPHAKLQALAKEGGIRLDVKGTGAAGHLKL